MSSILYRTWFLAALFFMALMVTSCTKEDLVEPCTSEHAGDAKSFGTAQDQSDWQGSSTGRGNEGVDDGEEIGDDGDDLSDSERNRKKKAN